MTHRSALSRARRVMAIGLLAALLPLALTAAPVAAANNVHIFAGLGDCRIFGENAGNKKTIKVLWRDSDLRVKSKFSVISNAAGDWSTPCEFDELVEAGDTFKTTIGTANRTFTIPHLTLYADRVGDYVAGEGPANGSLVVEVDTDNGGFGAPTIHSQTTLVDGFGDYVVDFTTGPDTADIRGWDSVYVYYLQSQSLYYRHIAAPALRVHINQPWLSVVGNPGQDVDVFLEESSTAFRGESNGNLDYWGERFGQFVNEDGDSVRAHVTDVVSANFATDATWEIPDVSASTNLATDRVTGDCGGPVGAGWEVSVHTRSYTKVATRRGNTNGSGNFTANFSVAPRYDLKAGDKVDVYCKLATGDVVQRSYTLG